MFERHRYIYTLKPQDFRKGMELDDVQGHGSGIVVSVNFAFWEIWPDGPKPKFVVLVKMNRKK